MKLFLDDNKFDNLRWETMKPKSLVNFLDLTLKIKNGHITPMTYQIPDNLNLYIPPQSSHRPGMLDGVIFCLH